MSEQKTKLLRLFFFPVFFVILLWIVKLLEITLHTNFIEYGVQPRTFYGLIGIVCSPLIHSDFNHLLNNSIPLLILGAGIFYFYRPIAYKIFFLIYLMTGFWTWLSGRDSYHIGASGLVYGFASFLFFSGVFRKDTRLMALSLLVVFLYGGLLWGLFPIDYHISWEGHLMGSLAGVLLAYIYRKEGPQRKLYSWELENEDENNNDPENEDNDQNPEGEADEQIKINYVYKPRDPEI